MRQSNGISVDWGQQIQAWQCSGLSQAANCRQQGLNYGSLPRVYRCIVNRCVMRLHRLRPTRH
ncbi:IS66 family insertion sequence element accessory protein TnpA [Methylomonas sp. 2BW1-5-20]|uniref:IS66 family insertion sequence element accessory protein TnpA n=1 Tax=Methylomonas sp. 2BW1-5-20 TaxID=3376686 RepID=UPI004050197C